MVDTDDSTTILWVKIAVIISCFVGTLLASLLPFFLAKRLSSQIGLDAISSMSALSAGVVLGSYLLHMLPEVAEHFTSIGTEYPFGFLLSGVVFMFLIAIDAVIVKRGVDGKEVAGGDNHDHISASLDEMARSQNSAHSHGSSSSSDSVQKGTENISEKDLTPFQKKILSYGSMSTSSSFKDDDTDVEKLRLVTSEFDEYDKKSHEDHSSALVRAWVFFLALSIHGTFDGLSVGSETNFSGLTGTLVAVLSHKLFDGIALGCAILPAKLPRLQVFLLLIICSATTPIGIGIGILAESAVQGEQVELVTAITIALASGSFLFISAMELIPSSLRDGRWVWLKLFLIAFGFTSMALVAIVV
jgi:solute carrier family 39 (zinc transporter), member 1/2/3